MRPLSDNGLSGQTLVDGRPPTAAAESGTLLAGFRRPRYRLPVMALVMVVVAAAVLAVSPPAAHAAGETCNGLPATIVGTDGPEKIVGTVGDDVIVGLGGDDVIIGRNGDDTICGGDGDDTLRGSPGDDTLFGDDGNDIVRGGNGDDTVSGGDGDDFVFGERDTDLLFGDGGDDRLGAGPGGDGMFGGPGDDTLIGGIDDDILDGGPGADRLFGRTGNDDIDGGADNDTARGNAGDDLLHGGLGNDTLRGGLGDDSVAGDAGGDFLLGESGDDVLWGGDGGDTLGGGPGDDGLLGGAGADDLVGGPGSDILDGEAGDNDGNGGLGTDECRSPSPAGGATNCESEPTPPMTVTSTDGILRIDVPAGALPAGQQVTIDILDDTQLPADVDEAPHIGNVYQLEPDGASFRIPVTITATLDLADVSGDPDGMFTVPVLRAADGTLDGLDDLTITFEGDETTITGATTHFSSWVFVEFDTSDRQPENLPGWLMNPRGIELTVGESFEAKITQTRGAMVPGETHVEYWDAGNPAVLEAGPGAGPVLNPWTDLKPGFSHPFTCIAAGSSAFTAHTIFRRIYTVRDHLNAPDDDPFLAAARAQQIGATMWGLKQDVSHTAFCLEGDQVGSIEVDVPIGVRTATYSGPDSVTEGSPLIGEICVREPDGSPTVNLGWFLTLGPGGNPADPDATHTQVTLGGDGCSPFTLQVMGVPTTLFTSDGTNVVDLLAFATIP